MLLRWNIFSLERAVEHRTVFVCDVILCWYGVELAAKQQNLAASSPPGRGRRSRRWRWW